MKPRKLRNLLEFKGRDQVRTLLAQASGKTRDSEVAEILLGYIKNTKWSLHGFYEGPVLHALMGICLLEKKQAKIQYLSVRKEDEDTGLEHELLEMVQKKHKLKKVTVRTTKENTSLYEGMGFTKIEGSQDPTLQDLERSFES